MGETIAYFSDRRRRQNNVVGRHFSSESVLSFATELLGIPIEALFHVPIEEMQLF